MQYLKQSTAATLKIGPFIDDTDGKTAETGLTIAQADVRLSKNGGDIAQKTEATSCTHDELGIYGCPIDATDTATLGRLQLWVHESGALPVWHEFLVIPANVYDSLFSTDKLEVDLNQIGGVAQSATDLKDFADAGYDPATNKIEGCKANDDMIGTDNAALASVCTEARLAELDAANIPADVDRILTATEIKQASVNDAAASTTVFVTNLAETPDDFWHRGALLFTSGNCKGQMRKIHGYNGTTKAITLYTALSYAPANNDTFIIVPARNFRLNIQDTDVINAEVDTALSDIELHKLIKNAAANFANMDYQSYLGRVMHKNSSKTHNQSAESEEAIRDRGDAAWLTGGAGAITAAEIADAVLDEKLGEHSDSGSLGEKVDGIKTRVPVSPWSKKDIDKHFKIIEAIAGALDTLPTVEKLNLLSKEIKELHSSSQVDSQKVQKHLERNHSAQIVTIDFKLKSGFESLRNQILSLNEKVAEVQGCIPDGKVDFTSINTELVELQKDIKELSETSEVKRKDVQKTLLQINETFKKIENTPFEKFSKYLKAMFIANLKTETIRSLLSEDLEPIKEVLREEEDG